MSAAAPVRAEATIPTNAASRRLQRLCRHFAGEVPTTWDPADGRIEFPTGRVRLAAFDGRLVLAVESRDPEKLAELERAMTRQLARFTYRSGLAVDWRPVEG
jgi:hypothetical protein